MLRCINLVVAGCFLLCISGARVPAAGEASNVVPNLGTDKVCYVPTPTMYSDPQFHYDNLRRLYKGCTHVMGSLEITILDSTDIQYDLSFLENIRYVSGHVAIYGNVYPEVVPLPRLEIIRGNSSFRYPVFGLPDISLLIGATDHKEVFMPSLKEITQGSVLISLNTSKHLCYLDTIDWSLIVKEGKALILPNEAQCPPCSRACELSNTWKGHCWGPSDQLCQFPAGPTDCAENCSKRCSNLDSAVCCHPQCAVGCTGPSPRDCLACKDFKMADGTCVSHCTDESRTNAYGQTCLPR